MPSFPVARFRSCPRCTWSPDRSDPRRRLSSPGSTVLPMGDEKKALRVLLLTSSPLEGHEGADKQLAAAIANGISQAEYAWFTRWPGDGKPRLTHGRPIPVLSKDGVPRWPERLQVTVAAAAFARRTDLVHAVMTIGGSFPVFSRLGR